MTVETMSGQDGDNRLQITAFGQVVRRTTDNTEIRILLSQTQPLALPVSYLGTVKYLAGGLLV